MASTKSEITVAAEFQSKFTATVLRVIISRKAELTSTESDITAAAAEFQSIKFTIIILRDTELTNTVLTAAAAEFQSIKFTVTVLRDINSTSTVLRVIIFKKAELTSTESDIT